LADGDPRWAFLEQRGSHATKLNELATIATSESDPDDILLFLDGDAIPVADLRMVLEQCSSGRLVAVRRDENLRDPIPHPSFCAVTVRQWHELSGDWRPGPTWVNAARQTVTDVGARIWANLEALEIAWTPLLRTNDNNIHDVWFGVYGDVVYHHGAGFRFPHCRHDAVAAEAITDDVELQALWCREQGDENYRVGAVVLARIAADPLNTLAHCHDGSLFDGLGVRA
jgi:hypothetical protein